MWASHVDPWKGSSQWLVQIQKSEVKAKCDFVVTASLYQHLPSWSLPQHSFVTHYQNLEKCSPGNYFNNFNSFTLWVVLQYSMSLNTIHIFFFVWKQNYRPGDDVRGKGKWQVSSFAKVSSSGCVKSMNYDSSFWLIGISKQHHWFKCAE